MSETCAEVGAAGVSLDGPFLAYHERMARRVLAAIHPDLPAMSVEDVRRAIAAARNNPQPLLDELDEWAEAEEGRGVAVSFPHEAGQGWCVTLTLTEQPDWTEWLTRERQFFGWTERLTRKRQFFGPTLTAAIRAALDQAREAE